MRNRRSAALFGVVAAGVMLTQQACDAIEQEAAPVASAPAVSTTPSGTSSTGSAPAPTSSSSSPSTSSSANSSSSSSSSSSGGGSGSQSDVLAGKRQIVIKPVQTDESILAVDPKGRLNATDGEAEHTLFVLSKKGDKYLIKTAKADSSGEPSCMGIKTNGNDPLTVVATACDASRAGQLFTVRKQDKKDNGRTTYAIDNQGAFLQIAPDFGLIAEELGDSPLRTTYTFVDNGKSTLPALD
ncbi:hypothetical protein [Actinoplanes sp. N902-109]|uniref:hypothetical protein n=1 Tax=Actinoplanes sp. (strain N902-109) TaxID=649831 RepID=UPI000329465B|nr:hypothetical protein [Actinoplanes sp. N902-109]AGL14270.1 hypothetical protein L083_0760 [Actinoplanes sp. N902-109]